LRPSRSGRVLDADYSEKNVLSPVQTLTESDGKVGWGVYGSTWAYREGAGGERNGGRLGKFTIVGRVVDVEGNAVVDAEVTVGKTMVYTGANGEFELTVRKRKAYALAVACGLSSRVQTMQPTLHIFTTIVTDSP
jgi:hypothetical protein